MDAVLHLAFQVKMVVVTCAVLDRECTALVVDAVAETCLLACESVVELVLGMESQCSCMDERLVLVHALDAVQVEVDMHLR